MNFNSGQSITCTSNDEFEIITVLLGGAKRVHVAKKLEPGMKLIETRISVSTTGLRVDYAHTPGLHIDAKVMDDYPNFFVYEPKQMCIERMHLRHTGNLNVNSRKTSVVHLLF